MPASAPAWRSDAAGPRTICSGSANPSSPDPRRTVSARSIVHGHTAIDQATHYGNRINLDSGAAYGGSLSAVVIEGREAALLTPQGRKTLPGPTPFLFRNA
jgi:hypothetical protein